jgi:LPXTG-motif cell wall-anchored protein
VLHPPNTGESMNTRTIAVLALVIAVVVLLFLIL